jgi:hypothetical protein
MKIVWWFLKKFKLYLPYDPATPLLGIHPKEVKSVRNKNMHSYFIVALFTIAKIQNQPEC